MRLGVTGFLGPHLLEALAATKAWPRIVALVRPPLSRVRVAPRDTQTHNKHGGGGTDGGIWGV